MKPLITSLFVILLSVTCYAADTSWNFLRGVDAISVSIDYSEATINGLSESDFVAYYSQYIHQENWYPTNQRRWKASFLKEFADATSKKHCFVGDVPNAKVKILITLISATDSGYLTTRISFIDASTNEILKELDMNSKGGHYGGILSLIADGFEHLGEKLGHQVRVHL